MNDEMEIKELKSAFFCLLDELCIVLGTTRYEIECSPEALLEVARLVKARADKTEIYERALAIACEALIETKRVYGNVVLPEGLVLDFDVGVE